jgi:hypothetical protein
MAAVHQQVDQLGAGQALIGTDLTNLLALGELPELRQTLQE